MLKADDCIGEEVKEKTQALNNGEVRCSTRSLALLFQPEIAQYSLRALPCTQVLVLENVRFYKEETKNDPGFAEKVIRYST